MKFIKLYEDFKHNNNEGGLITIEDIIDCIKSNGIIHAKIIKGYSEEKPKDGIKPVSIDDDGLITVEVDGNEYSVDIEDVEKINN
jgi:hypothetical protein